MNERFSVLVVCTGNICRSPIGERLLRQAFDTQLPDVADRFMVSSAGTYAGHRGEPMQPGALAVMAERGVPTDGFNATPLSASLIEAADLVLTAERGHRDACVRLVPSALRRAFTIKEFARLLVPRLHDPALLGGARDAGASPVVLAQSLVVAAAEERGAQPVASAHPSDDIDDPYAQPINAFRRTADEIDQAFGSWVRLLAASLRA